MQYIAAVLVIGMLVAEFMEAYKARRVTWTLILLIFHVVFVHAWLVVEYWSQERLVVDQRVAQAVALSDGGMLVAMCVMMIFRGGRGLGRQLTLGSRAATEMAMHVLLLMTLGVLALYFASVGFSFFSSDIEHARHIAKKGYGYQLIFVTHALPMAAMYYMVRGQIKHSGGMFYLTFLLMLLAQVATGFRAYLIMSLLIIFVIRSELNMRFSIKAVGAVVAVSAALFSFMTYRKIVQSEGSYGAVFELLNAINHRVVMELPWVIEKVIRLSDYNGYWYGMTYVWDVYSALPGPGESYGDKLLYWFNSKHELAGLAPITPSLVGESFANFGFVGVFVVSMLMMYVSMSIDRYSPKTDFGLVVKSMMGFYCANSVMVGLGGMMASRLLPMIFFVFFIRALALFLVATDAAHKGRA